MLVSGGSGNVFFFVGVIHLRIFQLCSQMDVLSPTALLKNAIASHASHGFIEVVLRRALTGEYTQFRIS